MKREVPAGIAGEYRDVAATGSLTDLDGVRVGLATDTQAHTGCAVVVFDVANVATAEVRGAAPGTREYALLQPGMSVQSVNAIVLAGGSAFGLAAADGVMRAMSDDNVGYRTEFGNVPIVPAAVLFDLSVGDPNAAPNADDGARAYRSASRDPVPNGAFGPGVGCSIAKWRNVPQPAGLGNASATVGGVTVAAMVALNATGDVFDLDGNALSGGPTRPDAPEPMAYGTNTTLMVLATDAALTREDLGRLVVRAHDAMGACVRPAHTRYDGDICFAVALGQGERDSTNVDAAGEAAFRAIGAALAAGVPVDA